MVQLQAQPHMANPISFKRIAKGLSTSTINCIYQDHYGFIWIGTGNGLKRYDGVSTKLYESKFNDTTSLSDNFVRCIYEDQHNRLWIGTNFGGLNLFIRDQDNFRRFKPGDRPNAIGDNAISSVTEDEDGTLWIGTINNGISLLLDEKRGFTHLKHQQGDSTSLTNNRIMSIFRDLSGNIWVGTKNGLNLYDNKSNQFTHFRHQYNDPQSISGNYISAIHQNSEGKIWIGTVYNGLNLLERDSLGKFQFQRFKHHKNEANGISQNNITTLHEDSAGKLWIGMDNGGLNHYDPTSGSFDHFYFDPNDKTSISNNSIRALYEDHSGMIWIGTFNQGLNVVDKYSARFKHYGVNMFEGTSLNNGNVTSIYEDDNEDLLIGTDGGGLNFYDGATRKFSYHRYDPENEKTIGSDAVICVYEDSRENLWIGTWNGGLNLFSKDNKTFKRYKHDIHDSTSIADNSIFSVLEDKKGRLWVVIQSNRLDLYDPISDSFRHVIFDEDEVANTNIYATKIFEDSYGYLWLCTERGLIKLSIDDNLNVDYVKFTYDEEDANGLSSNLVNTIYEDKQKNLWIGTGRGLNLFDRDSETFKAYYVYDGLPSNVIHGIVEDHRKNLWISTSLGVSKFDTNQQTFRNFDELDGLQSNEFLRGSCFSNGKQIYFGGIKGFNAFYPDLVTSNDFVPPVAIVGFYIDNQMIYPQSENSPLRNHIIETNFIELCHDQNNFGFDLAVFNYSQPEKNRYRYKLEGFDQDWQELIGHRSISYNKVSPGEYTLWVKGSNNDNLWNPRITKIEISILPPYWKRWWAYLAYVLVITGIGFWLYKNIVNRERLKNNWMLEKSKRESDEKIYKAKIQFFTNLSHELRTPLTLIIGPLEKLLSMHEGSKYLRKQLYQMNQNGHRLLRLVNQLLDFRKVETGNLELKVAEGNIIKFIREIMLSFQGHVSPNQIEWVFHSEVDNIQTYFDRDQLEKVFFNLLSNALKHTSDGGLVRIEVKKNAAAQSGQKDNQGTDNLLFHTSGYVEIAIWNNGVGIEKKHHEDIFKRFFSIENDLNRAQPTTGIGLSLVKTLIEMHKGEISVESVVNEFACFTIKLPLGNEHIDESLLIKDFKSSEDLQGYSHEDTCDTDNTIDHPMALSSKNEEELPVLLVVEDNTDVRNFIVSVLESDYAIYEASNGIEGLDMAIEVIPDLMISDVMMPGMDGITLCRKLKSEIKTSHIPIILLTARTSLIFKIEGLETGADDYITKPFNATLLKVRARNLVTSRKVLRKHFMEPQGLKIEPSKVSYTSKDEIFLNNLVKIVEDHISDSELSVEYLGREVGMSRMQLYRKVRSLTGFSTNEFIRVMRLKRAVQLIENTDLTISEITYDVGFTDLQYFRSCFKKQYKTTPSEYKQTAIAQ